VQVDARPFFVLTTPLGRCRCLRPKVRAFTFGVGAGRGPVSSESATHTVTAFSPLPADLQGGVRCSIDGQGFEVLAGGVAPTPAGARLYLRSHTAAVPA
jgi:hypothetical protein